MNRLVTGGYSLLPLPCYGLVIGRYPLGACKACHEPEQVLHYHKSLKDLFLNRFNPYHKT